MLCPVPRLKLLCALLPTAAWLVVDSMAMALQRAMGEFGAVSVISGNIIGRTQTLTLYVEGAYKVLMRSTRHACHAKH